MTPRRYLKDHPEYLADPKWAGRFCRALWRYREKSGFSKDMLAASVGVEEKDIARWETGMGKGSELPNPEQLATWLEHFGFEFLEFRYDGINLCGYPGDWSIAAQLFDSNKKRVTDYA